MPRNGLSPGLLPQNKWEGTRPGRLLSRAENIFFGDTALFLAFGFLVLRTRLYPPASMQEALNSGSCHSFIWSLRQCMVNRRSLMR